MASISERVHALEVSQASDKSNPRDGDDSSQRSPSKGERHRTHVQGDGHDSIQKFDCEHGAEHVRVVEQPCGHPFLPHKRAPTPRMPSRGYQYQAEPPRCSGPHH